MGGETNRINENPVFTFQTQTENQPDPLEFNLLNNENLFPDSNRDRFLGGDIWQFRLNQQYNAPPTTQTAPPNPDPRKVEDALRTIRSSLSEGFTDWDVSHGDLQTIQNTFNGLTAEEANEVFRQLTNDEIEKFASELSGTLGGYSRSEKQALFDQLAGKMSGENLLKLAEALGLGGESSRVRPDQNNQPDINLLADSISRNAPGAVKAEFVRLIAAKADKHQDAGAAAAQVLTSMQNDPTLLQQTLAGLNDTQLQAIVDGAARKTEVRSRGGTVTNYDPEPLAELLNAISTLQGEGAARQKARLFELGANKLASIENETVKFGLNYNRPAANLVRESLTAVIDSDTTGVIGALSDYSAVNRASGLTNYLHSLLDNGGEQKVISLIEKLQKGNDLSGNPYERFGASVRGDGNTDIYKNAQALGYFNGALVLSIRRMKDNNTKQAEVVKNLFGAAWSMLGVANPTTGVLAAGGNALTTQAINDILSNINKDTDGKGSALLILTTPTNPTTGAPYNGAATRDHDISSSKVINSN